LKVKEILLNESMEFSAGHKDKKDGYWSSDTDPGSRFAPEFYTSDKYDDGSIPPPLNPNFDPDLNLTLANANMYEVMSELGYDTEDNIPIDEFIGKTTHWLKQHIGKLSAEEPSTVEKGSQGATLISGGKEEGYFNDVIMRMNKIARIGKKRGATHVWSA
jgi:hypothetical protein